MNKFKSLLVVASISVMAFCGTAYANEAEPSNVSCITTLTDADNTIEEVSVVDEIQSSEVSSIGTGQSLGTFQLTGYYARTGAKTASGAPVQRDHTIAVDKRVIPLGTWVDINIPGEGWKRYKAEDTGSAVRGHKIDIYVGTNRSECFQAKYNSKVEVRLAN